MALSYNKTHNYFMQIAITNAKKGVGAVNPNPLVGAVLVKNNQVVSTGYHAKYGLAHAEVNCINTAVASNISFDNTTLYITLEPCSHHGKTPPCVDLIVEKGIKHCVIAMLDPNPLVAGKGLAILEEAGILVETGVLEEEAIELNRVFIHYITTKMPYIFLKCGITLDGKIATANFESKWITNSLAREKVQIYRNKFMAIMVGANTVLKDNPSLKTMLENGRNPYRIVLDFNFEVSENSKIITDNDDKKTILAVNKNHSLTGKEKLFTEKHGVFFIYMMSKNDYIDLFKTLGSMQIDSILIEGGNRVLSAMFLHNLYQAGEIFVASKIMGDEKAVPFVSNLGSMPLDKIINLPNAKWSIYGDNAGVEFYK